MTRSILSLLLCFAMMLPVYAQAANALDFSAQAGENTAAVFLGSSNHELIDKVSNDFSKLKGIGFVTDDILAYSQEDGRIVYNYAITEDIVSQISVEEDLSGGLTLDIVEGDLHNVLYYSNDGKLFVDGKEITFTSTVEIASADVSPRMRNKEYSATPFHTTTSSDFTIYEGTQVINSSELEKSIRDYTVTAVATILGAMFIPFPWGVGAAGGAILGHLIAPGFKTLAEQINPETAYFSYKINKYGTNKSQGAMWTYTQYIAYFYPRVNCVGESTSGILYEYDYFS